VSQLGKVHGPFELRRFLIPYIFQMWCELISLTFESSSNTFSTIKNYRK